MLNSTVAAGRPWQQAEGIFDAAFDAPEDASVGQLVDTASPVENEAVPAADPDRSENSLTTTGVSLIVAGMVCVLAAGAWILIRRRR
jgi:D-alanyl-D-alanine carboxypeptidase (penicillin-binding protein 5/6)